MQIEEVDVRVVVAPDAVVEQVQVLRRLRGEARHVLDALQQAVRRRVRPAPHPRAGGAVI